MSLGKKASLNRNQKTSQPVIPELILMCMCWSGYLSTHVAMMDSLKCHELTGKAIISHTIGGLCAGVAANWIFKLVMLIL